MNPKQAASLAQATLKTLADVQTAVTAGHPADRHLAALFRSNRALGSRDRRFISAVVFSFFRWRGWLDREEPARAAALAWALDATEPHPAQTALAGAEQPAWGGLSIHAKRDALGAFLGRSLSLNELVPPWLRDVVARNAYDPLVESFQVRPPTWLRLYAKRREAALKALTQHGAKPETHPTLTLAARCGEQVNLDPVRHASGVAFEVQDLASQCVGLICAPGRGETWWDACCGAGGKTLHLADLLQGAGRVVATDVRMDVLKEVRRRADAAGVTSVRVLPPGRRPDVQFDGVLVDAPCSGIGTWSRNPDMRWRTEARDVEEKSRDQSAILENAATRVRPGGVLVYAVCTTTVPETTGVTDAFLATQPAFSAEAFPDPRNGNACPAGCLTVQPWEGPCDGMFIARFRRKP